LHLAFQTFESSFANLTYVEQIEAMEMSALPSSDSNASYMNHAYYGAFDFDFLESCENLTNSISKETPFVVPELKGTVKTKRSPLEKKAVLSRPINIPPGTERPKRPLSAYNIFFRHEREKIITQSEDVTLEHVLNQIREAQTTQKTIIRAKRRHRKSHGLIGFAELARTIAEKWKNLDAAQKAQYQEHATIERRRYLAKLHENKKRLISPYNTSLEAEPVGKPDFLNPFHLDDDEFNNVDSSDNHNEAQSAPVDSVSSIIDILDGDEDDDDKTFEPTPIGSTFPCSVETKQSLDDLSQSLMNNDSLKNLLIMGHADASQCNPMACSSHDFHQFQAANVDFNNSTWNNAFRHDNVNYNNLLYSALQDRMMVAQRALEMTSSSISLSLLAECSKMGCNPNLAAFLHPNNFGTNIPFSCHPYQNIQNTSVFQEFYHNPA
jgi:HMG-box domain